MGASLYIALDNPEPGFDTFVNGKAISWEADNLAPICKSIGLPSLHEFINMSSDDLADVLGEGFELPDLEEEWFEADDGLRIFGALREHLSTNPAALKNSKAVVDDLDEYIEVLQQAKAIGAKWHLAVDA